MRKLNVLKTAGVIPCSRTFAIMQCRVQEIQQRYLLAQVLTINSSRLFKLLDKNVEISFVLVN
jgi:hypothetical protein